MTPRRSCVTDTWPAELSQGTVGNAWGTCTASPELYLRPGHRGRGRPRSRSPVSYTVPSTVDSGSVTNTATVSSTTTDPDGGNNSASDTNSVVEDVVLSVTKTFNSDTVTAGGASQTFTVDVTNAGVSDADNVTLTDTVDGRLVVDSIDAVTSPAPTPTTPRPSLARAAPRRGRDQVDHRDLPRGHDDEQRPGVSNTATGRSDEVAPTDGTDTVAIVENVVLSVSKTFNCARRSRPAATQPDLQVAVTNAGVSDADNSP